MTPESVQLKKEQGLAASQADMFWLTDLCDALAKALTSLDAPDFRCVVCGAEDEHDATCQVRLAEAALRGRWRVLP